MDEKRTDRVYQIAALHVKCLRGELNAEEHALLDQWINERQSNRLLFEELTDDHELFAAIGELQQFDADAALRSVRAELSAAGPRMQRVAPGTRTVRTRRIWRTTAAAALALAIGGMAFRYLAGQPKQHTANSPAAKAATLGPTPGIHRAWLLLDDGRMVVLDSLQNGTLTREGMTGIRKQNEELVYEPSPGNQKQGPVLFNTLSTERGKYALVLPDGSKVWLNAASSLRFPVVFAAKERAVQLTGEAYFEVRPDKVMPFRVITANGAEIEVLGTHFDVKAYREERTIKTTLLEGTVELTSGATRHLLKPGQAASVDKTSGEVKLTEADIREAVAWKNGLFRFEGTPIEAVMREIGRWYHLDITYEGKPPLDHFTGTIPRDLPPSKVFRILEMTGEVHVSITGGKVVVKP
jgi:transmembrane sensor